MCLDGVGFPSSYTILSAYTALLQERHGQYVQTWLSHVFTHDVYLYRFVFSNTNWCTPGIQTHDFRIET